MTDADYEAWEAMYDIWQTYHRRLFGMNGPIGIVNARELFLDWQEWFWEMRVTEPELMEATKRMAAKESSFEQKWESHFATVRRIVWEIRDEARANEASKPTPRSSEPFPLEEALSKLKSIAGKIG